MCLLLIPVSDNTFVRFQVSAAVERKESRTQVNFKMVFHLLGTFIIRSSNHLDDLVHIIFFCLFVL